MLPRLCRPALVMLVLVLAACESGATLPTAGPAGGVVALLLPERTAARYEGADRPFFEARLKELCSTCTVLYANAEQDAGKQQEQAEKALADGAQVLVLDPVDSLSASMIADQARAKGVPVISYDRLILNSSGVTYYISFDNFRVGELQARSLMDRFTELGIENPTILMINGSPSDNNAKDYKAGAMSVFKPAMEAGTLTIRAEFDTPNWEPAEAEKFVAGLLGPGDTIDGIYAANDGTAGGAINVLKQINMHPIPPVTGQDAELAALQRLLSGEQFMTVYKAIKPQAEAAAEIAFSLLSNQSISSATTGGKTINNGVAEVRAVLLTPIAVVRGNIRDTVIKDGFWKAEQICVAAVAAECAQLGIR
ncbi:MAG TPA: sugar ABC transporter substrate-binding protein [Herpetosiphonaceae bacterium]|nr:sugar ABC transporter substrate-binding protein [Herpetosiphonaceae bacterium]